MMYVKNFLKDNSEQEFKEFSQKLAIEGEYPILGVRIPILRQFAKKLVKEQDILALGILTDDSFEEVLLQGFVIACSKLALNDKKQYIDNYLSKAHSWGLIDSFASSFNHQDKELMFSWLEDYISSGETFKTRFGFVMMMKYLDDEHVEKIVEAVIKTKSEEYYVEMAQAWLLAKMAIKYPDVVCELLDKKCLNKFTHNKTIQKMVESYSIDKDLKIKVKGKRA